MILVAIGGGFDPLHIGHIQLMKEAKTLGDRLMIILFRDDQLIKKKNYFFMPYDERKKILESIKYVDSVVPNIDKDLTSNKSLEFYRPNIWAKSGDRQGRSESRTCERIKCKRIWGLASGIKQSSTELLRGNIYNNFSLIKGITSPVKVWGREVWITNNNLYCGKLLFLDKGAQSSCHCHKKKTETFCSLLGNVELIVGGERTTLIPSGEIRTIPPGEYHQFRGITEAVILEISTQHDENDVYRLSESRKGYSNELSALRPE